MSSDTAVTAQGSDAEKDVNEASESEEEASEEEEDVDKHPNDPDYSLFNQSEGNNLPDNDVFAYTFVDQTPSPDCEEAHTLQKESSCCCKLLKVIVFMAGIAAIVAFLGTLPFDQMTTNKLVGDL